MKVNRILMLTLFFIAAIAISGVFQLQADAATQEFIFNGYTIRVDGDYGDYLWGPVPYGILNLVHVNRAGNLALLPAIREVSVTDASGQQVPWEEAQSILAQALSLPFLDHPFSQPPYSNQFVDRKRSINVEVDGEIYKFSYRHPWFEKRSIADRGLRAHHFREAVLRAVTLTETRYRHADLLSDQIDKNLDESLELLGSANVWVTSVVTTMSTALEHSKDFKEIIPDLKGTANVLGALSYMFELAREIQKERDRKAFLVEMAKDLIMLQGLEDALLLMQNTATADPAMIDGMKMALDELTRISEDQLNSFQEDIIDGAWKTRVSLAKTLFPHIVKLFGTFTKGVPNVANIGGIKLRVAVEFATALANHNELTNAVATLAALTTLGDFLEDRIPAVVANRTNLPTGYPVRELIGFYDRVVSEEVGGYYNIVWEQRWNDRNMIRIGFDFGELTKDTLRNLDSEAYREVTRESAVRVHHTQEVYTRMPTFLEQLKQVYIPRPVPELTSLADIALIIDSSGSMEDEDPNNLRISGAQLFIQSADPKVQIAIVDFDGSAKTLVPLTFANFTEKDALKRVVEGVDASGSTDIDAGLQQGFQELNASTSSAKKAAVLLTDGQDNVAQQVISNYASRGWPIYTIGLGSGVDRRELERIAHATGGEYFEASEANLQTVYNKILAKTTGKSVIANFKGYINNGQQITKPVSIDNAVGRGDFTCNWQGSTIELVLIDPDGTPITPRDAAANSRITYQAESTYAIYTLENPKPGKWQMQATGTDIPSGGESFNLTVSATSDFSTNLLPFNSSYAVGDTIRIGIGIKEKIGDTFTSVLGATTSAKIVRPDGRIDTLTLYDDSSHNDGAANDGDYANNYRSVNKQGTYLIKVSAENGFSREIQEQVVVGSIDNVFIDGSTLTPAAGTTLKQAPSVISAVISGPAGRINTNSIVLKVDGRTVSHTYNRVNQLVSYRSGGLSGGSHNVQLNLRDVSGNMIETMWSFTTQVVDRRPPRSTGHYTTWGLPEGAKARLGKGTIFNVQYSPGGTLLAVASSVGIWIYDAETLQELTLLTGHTDDVRSVSFSPDGHTLASWSDDATVLLWDVDTGRLKKTLTGHTDDVHSVSFSPDGHTLASGSDDATVRLWDVDPGRLKKTLTGHTDRVFSVSFSPDGQTLASGSYDHTVRLWDVNTGRLKKTLTGHTEYVRSVSFSPDGHTLASGSWDDTVRLWDVNTGRLKKTLTGHTSGVRSVSFSSDGHTLASGSHDHTVRLWDVNTGRLKKTLTGHYIVSFSPDGQTLASGYRDGTLRLWDVNTGRLKKTSTNQTGRVRIVSFSPDGQTLASGSWDDTVRLWDVNTGRLKKTLTGHTKYVRSVSFSPDGQTLASGSWDDTVRLWDVDTGRLKKTLTGHTDDVRSVSFSPDGQTLASGSDDDTVRLWDVDTGRLKKTSTSQTGPALHESFSPDGQTIASASRSLDYTVWLWDIDTGRLKKTLTGHTWTVASLSFSPDGHTLASGSGDGTVRLWDVDTGRHLRTLTGHTSGVLSVSFSPDGQTLASGSEDDTVRLWDVNTGRHLRTLTGHTDRVFSVSFSPDGQTITSGSQDNTVLLWELVPSVPLITPVVREDVNGDGVVDLQDTTVVRNNLGQRGQNDADVNGDGIVDVEDLVLVLAAIEDAAGAPARQTQVLTLFTAEELQQWLIEARELADKSPAHRRGILMLEQLLALLTPKETLLLANYPNPFNPETWIPYHLSAPAKVTLTIYAVNGQIVRTLALGHQAAGFYESRSRAAYWDGRNAQGEPVASGVYFYTLTAGDFTATRKMLIRK